MSGPTDQPTNTPPGLTGDEILLTIFGTGDGRNNPYPYYEQLRALGRHHVDGLMNSVVFTGHADCREALRNNKLGSGRDGNQTVNRMGDEAALAARAEMQRRGVERGRATSMLFLDPPDHTRQRTLVSRAFTPRRMEALRPIVAEMTDACLDELEASDDRDLMTHLATPLPVSVISLMLGVPQEDWPTIRHLVSAMVVSLEPSANAEQVLAAGAAGEEASAYFTDLIAKRRAEPTDDLISGLIAARDADDELSEAEILAVTSLLFAAGAETTTNLIGNAVVQFSNHPDQWQLLLDRPELLAPAVDEVLRYDSPVQIDGRQVLEPTSVAGVDLEVGQRVTTLLGAANRDPDVYDDPQAFRIERFADPGTEAVMSFASGIHYCLGANLARVEGQEMLAGLARRFPELRVEGEPTIMPRLVLRGYEKVPLAW